MKMTADKNNTFRLSPLSGYAKPIVIIALITLVYNGSMYFAFTYLVRSKEIPIINTSPALTRALRGMIFMPRLDSVHNKTTDVFNLSNMMLNRKHYNADDIMHSMGESYQLFGEFLDRNSSTIDENTKLEILLERLIISNRTFDTAGKIIRISDIDGEIINIETKLNNTEYSDYLSAFNIEKMLHLAIHHKDLEGAQKAFNSANVYLPDNEHKEWSLRLNELYYGLALCYNLNESGAALVTNSTKYLGDYPLKFKWVIARNQDSILFGALNYEKTLMPKECQTSLNDLINYFVSPVKI